MVWMYHGLLLLSFCCWKRRLNHWKLEAWHKPFLLPAIIPWRIGSSKWRLLLWEVWHDLRPACPFSKHSESQVDLADPFFGVCSWLRFEDPPWPNLNPHRFKILRSCLDMNVLEERVSSFSWTGRGAPTPPNPAVYWMGTRATGPQAGNGHGQGAINSNLGWPTDKNGKLSS